MPTLEIRVPGEPVRRVALGAGGGLEGEVVLGRDAACQVQLAEKKASRRHLRLVLEPAGWVAEDLDSSNGTFAGESRILRRALADGLALRIGDTELVWFDPPAAAALGGCVLGGALVGGRLALTDMTGGSAQASGPATLNLPGEAAASPVAASQEDGSPEEGSQEDGEQAAAAALPPAAITRPLDMRSFGRALTVAVLGLAALVGVQLVLGAKAERARDETAARRQLADLLARSDVDAAAFQAEASHYLQRFPAAPDRALLERHIEAVGARNVVRLGVEARFETLLARLGSLPEDQVRRGLLALKRELSEDQGLAERVRLALVELDRRRAALERAEGERVREQSRALLAQGLPGPALFCLTAWQSGRGLISPAEAQLLTEAQENALRAVDTLAAQVQAAAAAQPDLVKRRRILAEAWPALAGTHAQEPLADALRFLSRPPRPTGPGTGPATGPDPEAAAQALLARGAEAERLFGAHRWTEARAAFEAAMALTGVGPLRQEWATRVADVERVVALVDVLAAATAAAGDKPPRVTLAAGLTPVRGADHKQVTLERAGATTAVGWPEIEPDDLLALLTPPKPTRDQRLAVAVLAASVGRPEALVLVLTPLYAAGTLDPEVDAAVARLLEGREKAPEGGYRLHQGRLLDRAAYERVLEEERLNGLAARTQTLLERLAKEPVLKKLERLREARAELDRRRQYALLAIFNETHYPYPYRRGTPPYIYVQAEVDRRVAAVRELWEGDDHVKIARTGSAGQLLEEAQAQVRELAAKGRDVVAFEQELARVAPYMTGETIRLRDFCLDAAEQQLHDYNTWVMQVYNAERSTYIQDSERVQVGITNEYRMLLGFTAAVAPGDASYEAIDESNVAKILDAGHIVPGSVVHLRAVRVDDRLVRSARLHSLDMQKRGFFDHFAPPNPATGEARTSPFDRMRVAGYEGMGASENIAQSGGPKEAHEAWCHSSGHHRNILSSWADMGTGQAGGALWTQNFGTGGGKPTRIEPAPEPPPKR